MKSILTPVPRRRNVPRLAATGFRYQHWGFFMIRSARLAAVAGIAAAASLAVTGPAEAATYSNILNYNSGLCLSVAGGGSTANGAKAIQWTCNGGGEQAWAWSGHRLVNYKSGKCLSVSGGGSTANGAELVQWTCNGGAEQDWYPSSYRLVNGKSGKVASIEDGGSTRAGANVIQWSDNGGPEQYWTFRDAIIDA